MALTPGAKHPIGASLPRTAAFDHLQQPGERRSRGASRWYLALRCSQPTGAHVTWREALNAPISGRSPVTFSNLHPRVEHNRVDKHPGQHSGHSPRASEHELGSVAVRQTGAPSESDLQAHRPARTPSSTSSTTPGSRLVPDLRAQHSRDRSDHHSAHAGHLRRHTRGVTTAAALKAHLAAPAARLVLRTRPSAGMGSGIGSVSELDAAARSREPILQTRPGSTRTSTAAHLDVYRTSGSDRAPTEGLRGHAHHRQSTEEQQPAPGSSARRSTSGAHSRKPTALDRRPEPTLCHERKPASGHNLRWSQHQKR